MPRLAIIDRVSDKTGKTGKPGRLGKTGRPGKPDTTGDARTDPHPEPIRFFGTTWVNHDAGYTARRVGVAAGSLAAAVATGLILRLAYEGLRIAEVGGLVTLLMLAMFAICSALAFGHTWAPSPPARTRPARHPSAAS